MNLFSIFFKKHIGFVVFIFLSNFFVFFINFTKFILQNRDYTTGSLIHPWVSVQYYFTYYNEFSKRALVGSAFNFFSIGISEQSIFIFSILSINIFFIFFYIYAKKAFDNYSKFYFNVFILIILVSPAFAMQRGFMISFLDNANLAILIMTITFLTYSSSKINYILIPLLIIIGTLTHEAFLLTSVPLIFAISLHEIYNKNKSIILLIVEFFTVLTLVIIIYLHGQVDQSTLDAVGSTLPYNARGPAHDAFLIWTRNLSDNLPIVFSEYKWATFRTILPILLLVILYSYFFIRILKYSTLNIFAKFVFLSPFSLLLIFIIAHDFARFLALLIISICISFLYLLKFYKPTIVYTKVDKILVILLILFSFAGPTGIMTGFPYFFHLW